MVSHKILSVCIPVFALHEDAALSLGLCEVSNFIYQVFHDLAMCLEYCKVSAPLYIIMWSDFGKLNELSHLVFREITISPVWCFCSAIQVMKHQPF